MRETGCLQPVLLRPAEKGRYEIIDGEHRWRVAQKLGAVSLEAVIHPCSREEAALLRIAMNKLRGELNYATVASILAESVAHGMTNEQLLCSGLSEQEMASLLKSVAGTSEEDVLHDRAGELEEKEEKDEKLPVLELALEFDNEKDLSACKRALKKNAGKGQPLARGLLKVLGLLAEKEDDSP
jgi:ParB-like chromosome segregation protein Spo0J